MVPAMVSIKSAHRIPIRSQYFFISLVRCRTQWLYSYFYFVEVIASKVFISGIYPQMSQDSIFIFILPAVRIRLLWLYKNYFSFKFTIFMDTMNQLISGLTSWITQVSNIGQDIINRVCMAHRILTKSWNFSLNFSGLEYLWKIENCDKIMEKYF